MQNILASASEDSFDNRAHLTGSSVCATMSSSVDSSSLATTVAPNQAGVSVQSFGFQSPVVVNQFSHGPPPLVHASVYPLSPTSGDLYYVLILKILLKGLHPALVKHHLGVILGLVGCRRLTSGLVRHQGLGLLLTPSLQASTHTCCSPVPPLASDVHCPDVGSPFWLCFVHGKFSCCNGMQRPNCPWPR